MLQDGSIVEKTTWSVLLAEDSTINQHERRSTDLTNDYCRLDCRLNTATVLICRLHYFVRLQQRTSDSVTAHEQALTSKSARARERTRETAALIYCSSECTRTRGPSRHVTRELRAQDVCTRRGQSASMRVSCVISAACARRCPIAPRPRDEASAHALQTTRAICHIGRQVQ